MSKQCYLKPGDLVQPITAKADSVWRVTEVSEFGFSLTASKITLEPGEEWHTATGPIRNFKKLEGN